LTEIEKGNYARGVSFFFAAYDSGQTKKHEPFPSSARNLIAGWSKHIGTPVIHDALVSAVAFSPDGKTVLTGSRDNTARLWEAATGEPRGETMQHEAEVSARGFSPDGKTVFTLSSNTVRLWDAATGESRGKTIQHEN
jgi:WD40 repeat protein